MQYSLCKCHKVTFRHFHNISIEQNKTHSAFLLNTLQEFSPFATAVTTWFPSQWGMRSPLQEDVETSHSPFPTDMLPQPVGEHALIKYHWPTSPGHGRFEPYMWVDRYLTHVTPPYCQTYFLNFLKTNMFLPFCQCCYILLTPVRVEWGVPSWRI